MDQDLRIARAKRARVLLSTDDVTEAFADVERDLFDHWQSLAWDEKAQAECLRADKRALDRLRGKLQQWADELTFIEHRG